MTTPTQGEVRAWARAQGMTVNDRGSLPVSVTAAYALAHDKSTKGTTMTSPARKNARKATARKATARKATARKTTARKATATKAPARKSAKATAKTVRARKATPVRRAAPASVKPAVSSPVNAPAAGTADLAGGLRSYLGSIDVEVRAVSALSEKIDGLVSELNDLRDQQAKRLIVLDALRASVSDKTLSAFLDQAIKPRKTRVSEVIPDRLS